MLQYWYWMLVICRVHCAFNAGMCTAAVSFSLPLSMLWQQPRIPSYQLKPVCFACASSIYITFRVVFFNVWAVITIWDSPVSVLRFWHMSVWIPDSVWILSLSTVFCLCYFYDILAVFCVIFYPEPVCHTGFICYFWIWLSYVKVNLTV